MPFHSPTEVRAVFHHPDAEPGPTQRHSKDLPSPPWAARTWFCGRLRLGELALFFALGSSIFCFKRLRLWALLQFQIGIVSLGTTPIVNLDFWIVDSRTHCPTTSPCPGWIASCASAPVASSATC